MILKRRGSCNSHMWVLNSMFSVGTRPSFQILDYYNGGTKKKKKKSEMSSGLIKLKWSISLEACLILTHSKNSLKIPKRYQNPQIEEQENIMAKRRGQNDKQRSTKYTHKTKDRVTRTPLKTGDELRCSGRVRSSCSTSEVSILLGLQSMSLFVHVLPVIVTDPFHVCLVALKQ